MKVRTGRVVCVSKIAVGDRRAELHASGAIAVDMESVWLAPRRRAPVRRRARRARQSVARAAAPQAVSGAAAARALRRVAARFMTGRRRLR